MGARYVAYFSKLRVLGSHGRDLFYLVAIEGPVVKIWVCHGLPQGRHPYNTRIMF